MSDDDLERLEAAAAQLLILYPRLTEALEKDQARTDGRPAGSDAQPCTTRRTTRPCAAPGPDS